MTCLDIISDSTGKEIVAAIQSTDVAQARISEINTAAESKKNEVLASIPEDYSSVVNEVDQIKGDLDTERNARIEGDTALSTRIQKVEVSSSVNRYEIDNIKAKAEGKLYRTETVEAEAYTVDVPSSVSPYAEVQRIGGKSVVWNQLRQSYNIGTNYGITVSSNGNGTINVQGTATSTPNFNQFPITKTMYFKRDGRKYFITSNLNIPNGFGIAGYDTGGTKDFIFSESIGSIWHNSIYIKVTEGDVLDISNLAINIIDLTQMFGSGNEPTIEECRKIFSDDIYPYDAGTIKSFPVQRVKSLNAEGIEIGSIDVSSFTSDFKSTGSAHDEWSNGKKIKRVGERAYTSGDESESNYITDYTTTYYPLDTPTEETVPEISNFIQIEGGGTLTFESDDTIHIPVPSTDRFVVDLTSTTEETT